MRTLELCYQTVIDHIDVDVQKLNKSGQPVDLVAAKFLGKRQTWLIQRKNSLYDRQDIALCDLKCKLETYISFCTAFWKKTILHVHEDRQDSLMEVTKAITKAYSYSGFEAYHSIFLLFKKLRFILPLEYYKEHEVATTMLQDIKTECMSHLRLYINPK